MTGPLVKAILAWLLLFGLWIALTDTVRLQELAAGAALAAVATGLATLVERDREPGGASRPRPSQILRPLASMPIDTTRLAFGLLRHLRGAPPPAGAFRRKPLEGDPLFAEWWGSLAPGQYVIGVDREDGSVLVHEMRREDRR